jgi:hypothetical protein
LIENRVKGFIIEIVLGKISGKDEYLVLFGDKENVSKAVWSPSSESSLEVIIAAISDKTNLNGFKGKEKGKINGYNATDKANANGFKGKDKANTNGFNAMDKANANGVKSEKDIVKVLQSDLQLSFQHHFYTNTKN